MKSIRTFSSILIACTCVVFLGFALVLSSCGGAGGDEPEPSATEKAIKNLTTSPWKVVSVTVDGTNQSALFTGLHIEFRSQPSFSYTATNGGMVWPSTGGWSFTDNTATVINRGDGLTIQITNLTETSLVMSLAWTKNTFGGGREGSIGGQHVFTMGK
jgi:hypothetical protein